MARGDRMKIVHILTRLLRAGSEENTLLTAAGQVAAGHDVVLMHGRDVLPEFARDLAPGARLVTAPSLVRNLSPIQDSRAVLEIRRSLAKIRPDVVHTHQSKAGIVGRFAAASAGVPLVVHGVHILPFLGVGPAQKAVYLRLERAAARMTDGFIHVSEGMRGACHEHGVGTDRAHYVVPSGFDLSRFRNAEPPSDWRQILGIAPGDPQPFVIAMLAALEPRKRHLDLLRQSAGFLKQFPQVRLVFAGDGHLRAEVEAAIKELGLDQQVALLGYRNDPERIIAMADICIHTAEREGLPRSVLQYLAAGRPVVLFDLPGIEEVVTHGENGFVVPQNDWRSFLERVGQLAASPERRAAMAGKARATRLERWDEKFMAERTLAIYEELLPRAVFREASA
ncbi:glycosyltransferase family 4 protein [Thalassovita aquimarina]|uniref:glycosyltransferase family 4 protein n=1 Tax=Thalassovita aquimarina TaxID=2785917 RepID=UPI0035670D14